MRFFDSFLMAIRSIKANKTRSALTMLGVIIGIAAVIILVAIGEAAKLYVVAQVKSWGLGPNVLQLNPGKNPGDYTAMINSKIRVRHAYLIRDKCPDVVEVVPIVSGSAKMRYWKKEYTAQQAWGVTDNYLKVFTHPLKSGRFFSKGEVDSNAKVCVLGQKIVKELFGNFDPVGDRIKILGRKFTVIGVFKEKGKMFGYDMDDVMALPVTTAMSLFDTKSIIEMDIAIRDEKYIDRAISQIRAVMDREFSRDDYQISTQEGMMSLLNNIIGLLTSVIGGIAAISLIVGGIGIMNIMLVSVTERTKEIGIRKAVGAKKSDIFVQFLVESVVVSFLGGLGGIVLGLAGTFMVMFLIKLEMVVVVWALTLAVSVSIGIGVISGVYPAMRAVNLDPIEALRYE